MKIDAQYREHIGIMKQFYESQGHGKVDEQTASAFDAIYNQSLNIELKNAKDFLASLDSNALQDIQEYHHLADPIDVASLSNEGSANLLAHRHELIDYNNDGLVEVGRARVIPMLPQTMSGDLKQAIVESLEIMANEGAGSRDLFTITGLLAFRLNLHLLINIYPLGPANQTPQQQPACDFAAIEAIGDRMRNPVGPEFTDPQILKTFERFFDILEERYTNKDAPMPQNKETFADKSDSTLMDRFLDRVRAAGGMLAFVQKLNYEKIQMLIEERRAELEEQYNADEAPKSGEERATIQAAIEVELETYKKELFKELQVFLEETSALKKERLRELLALA